MTAKRQPKQPEVVDHRLELGPVRVGLLFGLVHGAKGRSGKLDLRARLEGDRSIATAKRDHGTVRRLALRFPTSIADQALEDRFHAHGSVVWKVGPGIPLDRDSFRLRAHEPPLARSLRVVKRRKQVIHPV